MSQSTQSEPWQGELFSVNMSFDSLDSSTWQRLLTAFWSDEAVKGPFVDRFNPYENPIASEIMYPERSTSYIQHGAFDLGHTWVGVDLLVTRSLFECLTFFTPEGMFEDKHAAAHLLEPLFQRMAIRLFQAKAFGVASFGWNRDCYLTSELMHDMGARDEFFAVGNCLIKDEVLIACQHHPKHYEEVLPRLRWIPGLL